jgi:transposase
MKTIYNISCGLDVHRDTVVACILKTINFSEKGRRNDEVAKEIITFGTFYDDLQELKSWLEVNDCRHVAMESTGVYWCPVHEALEDAFDGDIEILLVNARHMRNVPGKKTDVNDAEWIADLLRSGLLRGSFVPPKNIRELRELTRYRKNIVQDITKQKNRVQKTLQIAGFKISSFISDIFGVSGRFIMKELIDKAYLTKKDVDHIEQFIEKDKCDEIKRVLTNKISNHHRKFLDMQLKHIDELISHLKSVETEIAELSTPLKDEITRLDTVPGISLTAAHAIVAEIGTDMDKFRTSEHICSWAGLSPGSNESAGKKKRLESLTETPT